jgi:tRNA A37 N6-isopentenylltransferase MiaA
MLQLPVVLGGVVGYIVSVIEEIEWLNEQKEKIQRKKKQEERKQSTHTKKKSLKKSRTIGFVSGVS